MQRIEVCVLFAYLAFCSQAKAQGGIITTVAGSGGINPLDGGFSGDGGPATSALLNFPWGVAVDASGNIFIADTFNHRVRKVSASGIITTVAGIGPSCGLGACEGGFSGDGGPATAAALNFPYGVAVDASGNLFIADFRNDRIRKVSANGIITTVAGGGSRIADGVPATAAGLGSPTGVAVDASGNLFIADGRIRKVSANGIITTVAGNGCCFGGDGGPATSALLFAWGVAADASGNLFIADSDSGRIRKVSTNGFITTVAGNGGDGFSGDGGPAISASLVRPEGVAVDASGNLYIADDYNYRVRKVSAATGIITTFAGGNNGFSLGDGGPATPTALNGPTAVAVDAAGNLFIADTGHNRIRQVRPVGALGAVQNAASYAAGAVSPGEIVVLYGAGMGPAALATLQVDSTTGRLQTTLAGTTVLFDGNPAPILYTSANQVSAIVPYEIAGAATAQVYVNYQGRYVAAGPVTAAPSAPAIFTVGAGSGQAAALNQDGSVNSASNPAAALSTIVLYLTGEGQTNPPGTDGRIAATAPLPAPILPVTVRIGGQAAAYAYAGAAPGEVAGVMQINATIPAGVTGNAVAVSVQIGTVSTQSGVTIAVQ